VLQESYKLRSHIIRQKETFAVQPHTNRLVVACTIRLDLEVIDANLSHRIEPCRSLRGRAGRPEKSPRKFSAPFKRFCDKLFLR
jgi:hypothetical protein